MCMLRQAVWSRDKSMSADDPYTDPCTDPYTDPYTNPDKSFAAGYPRTSIVHLPAKRSAITFIEN